MNWFIEKLTAYFLKKEQHGTGWDFSEPQDDRAYRHEEIADVGKAAQLQWVEKPVNEWKKYLPIRNQNGSSACVAFATALVLGILNYLREGKFVVLSPKFIYSRGFIENGGGMYYFNGLTIGANEGCPLDVLLPSDSKGETEMRSKAEEKEGDRQVAKVYAGNGESIVYLPIDFDIIGQVVDLGVPVLFGIRFNSGGLTTGVSKLTENGVYGHGIALTDRTMYGGEKALVYQNSYGENWGFGGLGVVQESQKAGIQFASYYKKFERIVKEGVRPKLKLASTVYLANGSKGADVVRLQTMLQWLGFFDATVECTGNFYGITRQAVRDFQKANGLTVNGIASGETVAKLNEQFI